MVSQDRFDEGAVGVTQWLAEGTSRRSFLAHVGGFILALVGATVIESLPIGPANVAEAATDCGNWINCGISGYPCDGCGGGGNSCPSGSTPSGASWSACCSYGFGQVYLVQYQDCQYPIPSSGNCCSGRYPNGQPNCCGTPFCPNNPQATNWVQSNYCYKCTMATVLDTCL